MGQWGDDWDDWDDWWYGECSAGCAVVVCLRWWVSTGRQGKIALLFGVDKSLWLLLKSTFELFRALVFVGGGQLGCVYVCVVQAKDKPASGSIRQQQRL